MRLLVCLSISILFLGSGCTTKPYTVSDQYMYVQSTGREQKKWKLVWSDEFNKPELDSSKWTRIPPGKSDWNRHMTAVEPACYNLKGGVLELIGIVNKDTLKDPRPFLTGVFIQRRSLPGNTGGWKSALNWNLLEEPGLLSGCYPLLLNTGPIPEGVKLILWST